MTNSFTPRLVLVTTSSMEEARRLAEMILREQVAACINLIPGMESFYCWHGQLEHSQEVLMVIKSSTEHFGALRDLILQNHSYSCPEVIAIAVGEMAPSYRTWWEENLKMPL